MEMCIRDRADIAKLKEVLDRTTPDNISEADVAALNEGKEPVSYTHLL